MNKYQVFKSGPRKGQPKTLTDRVVRYLVEGLHMNEVPTKSGKYRTFMGSTIGDYFVGKNGAVRAGKSSSNSISLTDRTHARMYSWEVRNANPIKELRP